MSAQAPQSIASRNMSSFLNQMAASKAASLGSRTGRVLPRSSMPYVFWRTPDSMGAFSPTDTSTGNARAKVIMDVIFRVICLSLATAQVIVANDPIPMTDHIRYMTAIGTLFYMIISAAPARPELDTASRDLSSSIIQTIGTILPIEEAAINLCEAGSSLSLADVPGSSLLASYVALADALGLPPIGAVTADLLTSTLEIGGDLERASYFALVVYLCGRPIAESTVAISDKRPKNLEAKYNQGAQWPSISGPVKMSTDGAKRVGMAWEIDGAFSPTLGAVATMVALLDMAQLAHVKIIMDFFNMYPWVADMPGIAREVNSLATDSRIWAGYPAAEQPFAKLLYRDQFKVFDSKGLARLVALAVDVMGVAVDTYKGYKIKGADAVLRQEFDAAHALHVPQAPTATTQVQGPATI